MTLPISHTTTHATTPGTPSPALPCIGHNSSPPKSAGQNGLRYYVCTRCGEHKTALGMAKKDARRYRSWCKDCDSTSRRKAKPEVHSLAADAEWQVKVSAKQEALRKRGIGRHICTPARSAEMAQPVGQAASWYEDVHLNTFGNASHVAYQIARLCGHDSEVTLPLRSLADAVGRRDEDGRLRSFTDTGIRVLVERGWLETAPQRERGTTFRLKVGDVDYLSRKLEASGWKAVIAS